MAYALFALNALVFFGAAVASYFAHDPDERLDALHHSLKALDKKKHKIRTKLYAIGTKLNGFPPLKWWPEVSLGNQEEA
jgi:hypothetical protein